VVVVLALLCTALAAGAAIDHAWIVVAILNGAAGLLVLRSFQECAGSMATVLQTLKQQK
jgi:hypothetical protein